MLFELVELDQGVTKKDGLPYYRITVIGKFTSFGKVKKVTQEINVSMEDYSFLIGKEGKEFEIEMIYAKSEFPMLLASPISKKQSNKLNIT